MNRPNRIAIGILSLITINFFTGCKPTQTAQTDDTGSRATETPVPNRDLKPNTQHQLGIQFPESHQIWTNTLGMKFVMVPGIKVFFGIWDTRVQDYQAFVTKTHRNWSKPDWDAPSYEQEPTEPAVNVSWDDAHQFCEWLTKKEQREGKLGIEEHYRLPTDAEWSVAAGLGSENGNTPKEKDMQIREVYPWGNRWPPPPGSGNYPPELHVDFYDYTSPVGSFPANCFGLYDMGGNVCQWCEDSDYNNSPSAILRGSDWYYFDYPIRLSSAFRTFSEPREITRFYGFRCVKETYGSAIK